MPKPELPSQQKVAQALIQWVPTGATSWLMFGALKDQAWVEAVALFPVCCVTAVWTAYSKSVVARLSELSDERGKKDVDAVVGLFGKLSDAIKWQFAGIDAKYLQCQGSFCREYETEGYRSPAGNFTPLLGDVFVPLQLSSQFILDDDGNELPNFPGFRWQESKKITPLTEAIEEIISSEDPSFSKLFCQTFKLSSLSLISSQQAQFNIWDIFVLAKTQPIFRRLLFKGSSGLGKTTLLRYIEECYAHNKIPKQYRHKVPKLLPLLFKLDQRLITEKIADLSELIQHHYHPKYTLGKSTFFTPNQIRKNLINGIFLVMLDGFDEVEVKHRGALSKWIGQQMKRYPECIFIVTSRPKVFHEYYEEKSTLTEIWIERTFSESAKINIWEALIRSKTQSVFGRLAIKAWGGYGKTTLLRHLTYCYTNNEIPKQYRRKVPKLLPVLLPLRQWQGELIVEQPPSLPDLIQHHHFRSFTQGKDLALPPNWAKQHLNSGDFLVMFDGFDEVMEEHRGEVSEWIGQQMTAYSDCVFILTSRPKAFDEEYKAQPNPTKIWVQEFNEPQQERFIFQWNLAQELYQRMEPEKEKLKADVSQITTNLMEQLRKRESLGALAKNPLLLNMIVNLHRFYRGNPLPKRRARLYDDIFKLQLQDRPLDRGIEMPLDLEESLMVLQWVAFVMVKNLKETRIEKARLNAIIQQGLEQNSFENETTTENFLYKIEDVSELIVNRDSEYEFAHRSFQEYLAAKYIKQNNLESLLLENWADEWWNSTTILYVTTLKKPSDFVRQLLSFNDENAKALAIKCWQETPREIDTDVLKNLTKEEREEIKSLDSEVKEEQYKQLKEYLKNQDFKGADKETNRVMLEVLGKEADQYLEVEEIKNFPCEDLKKIDNLWKKYSKTDKYPDGKFGFSVQKKIWLDCGGIPGKYDYGIYRKFAMKVGWHMSNQWVSYEKLNFTTEGVYGHLPGSRGYRQEAWTVLGAMRDDGLVEFEFGVSLFSRADL